MILWGVYAWMLYHSGVQLRPISTDEAQHAMCKAPARGELAEFKQSTFYRNFKGYVPRILPTHNPATITLCGLRCARRELKDASYKFIKTNTRLLKAEHSELNNVYVVHPLEYIKLRASLLSPVQTLFLANACACSIRRFPFDESQQRRARKFALLSQDDVQGLGLTRGTYRPEIWRLIGERILPTMESLAECRLACLLFAPPSWGGWGLPLAQANPVIETTKVQKALLGGQNSVRPDFYWPKQKLALEYDSNMFHSTSQQVKRDKAREVALAGEGIRVLPVTSELLQDPERRQALLLVLCKHLGVSRPKSVDWPEKNQLLIESVYRNGAVH